MSPRPRSDSAVRVDAVLLDLDEDEAVRRIRRNG
jgi:hypothetical protein